jgi:putative SOS response-associated peptidase YedK
MCGRASQEEVDAYFNRVYGWQMPEDFTPRRNLRPTEEAYIVAHHPSYDIKTVPARWWCQPDGAREWEAKLPSFNIRVDTMDQKRLWAPLLKKGKRCVFPIDAFYEWPVKGRGIPPVKIMLADREPYGIAGLWSTWFDNGERKYSFATFTVEPNEFMKPIHPQAMPVILDSPELQKLWLMDGDRDLLVPYTGEMIVDQMPDTLERLYPEENQPPKPKVKKEDPVKAEGAAEKESIQGSLF